MYLTSKGSSFWRTTAHGSVSSSFLLNEKLRTTGCHVMLEIRSVGRFRSMSVAGGSPESLSIVSEFDLVCVLDEVESLALDLFTVDQSTYLCLQILDGDERSLLKVGLQRCEYRARMGLELRVGSDTYTIALRDRGYLDRKVLSRDSFLLDHEVPS